MTNQSLFRDSYKTDKLFKLRKLQFIITILWLRETKVYLSFKLYFFTYNVLLFDQNLYHIVLIVKLDYIRLDTQKLHSAIQKPLLGNEFGIILLIIIGHSFHSILFWDPFQSWHTRREGFWCRENQKCSLRILFCFDV